LHKDVDPLALKEVVEKGEIWVGRKIIPNLLEELPPSPNVRKDLLLCRRLLTSIA
jgi:hypothetical protein